jgi:hypothetical protein
MAEERMQQARDPGAIRAAPGRDLASDPAARRRPLPRGWDEPVSLDADPAVVPDPAEVPVPDELRREIEAAMAKYPDRRSAAIPSLGRPSRARRRPAALRLVLPEGLARGGGGDAGDPGLPVLAGHLL